MPNQDLQNVVAAALESSDPRDVEESVKSAVITELELLDPSARIRKTEYFNHSFAPDLVLDWGKNDTREVYLRYSFRAAQAAGDVRLLGARGPMFFSLDSGRDDGSADIAEAVRAEVALSPRAFVTNAPAFDSFGTAESAATDFSRSESVTSPLLHLFRRSVVQSGQGLLTADAAKQLDESAKERSELDYLSTFPAVVSDVLREDAVTRLRRAADLLRAAVSGDTEQLDLSSTGQPETEEGNDASPTVRGQLTPEEARVLLPHVLRRSSQLADARFFRYLGEMLSLRQLEEMASELDGLDLNRFVLANMDHWRASKAMLSFNSDFSTESAPKDSQTAVWQIHGKMLSARAGAWLVHFATDNRRGGSRSGQQLAVWEDLLPALSRIDLSGVDLQGASRRIQVSADDDSSVLADVDAVRGTIPGEFRVRSVDVRATQEDSSGLRADFATSTCLGREVPLQDMAAASFDVLGYRYPLTDGERRTILG